MFASKTYVLLQIISLVVVTTCQRNVCQKCEEDPNSCRKIAGIFLVTVLTKGTYNPVVEIPAPACNINITELARSRNYIAVKTTDDDRIINGFWRVTSPGQYKGAGTVFRYSKSGSGSCPGECVLTPGPTNKTIVIQLLYYGHNQGISYEFTLPNYVPFTPYEGSQLIGATSRGYRHHLQNRKHHRHSSYNSRNPNIFSGGERNPYSTSDRSEAPISLDRQEFRLSGSNRQPAVPQTPRRRYGYDTLGGRGLSYSQGSPSRSRRPLTQGSRSPLVLAPRPRYISPYSRDARYNYNSRSALTANTYERHVDIPNKLDSPANLPANPELTVARDDSYEWKISGFSKCSEPCGGGFQKTLVVCVLRNTQVTVTDENCESKVKPQSQQVECNTNPCSPSWQADDWAQCSVSCGSGTQTRRLECRQKISSTLELSVSASLCDQDKKPAIAQQCEMGRCAEWKVGIWQTCSVPCGRGQRRRSVKCVDHHQSQIPNTYCNSTVPVSQETCDMGPCRTNWLYTPWSKMCSSGCGAGVKTRQVLCFSKDGSEVQASACDASSRPREQASCHSDETCGSKWFTGPWSECSSECGRGVKTRYVVCMKVVGDAAVVSRDEDCWNTEKPSKEEECNNRGCGAEWFMTEWSQCSVTCGTGYRTREVKCLDRRHRLSSGCDVSSRPTPQETCQPRQCPVRELTAENDCRDLYRSCPLVVRSRLCSYKYYQQICCVSCRGHS